MPIINLLDKSAAKFSPDWMKGLAGALTAQLTMHVIPEYRLGAWSVHYAPNDEERIGGVEFYDLVFLDHADAANALGYHTRTDPRYYFGTMFMSEIEVNGTRPETTASHECTEMACDPDCSTYEITPAGLLIAREPSDPVEDVTYTMRGYDDYQLSNFVHRAWFLGDSGERIDQVGTLRHAGDRTAGGYQIVVKGGEVQSDPPEAAERMHKKHPSSRTWRRLHPEGSR